MRRGTADDVQPLVVDVVIAVVGEGYISVDIIIWGIIIIRENGLLCRQCSDLSR